MKYILAVLLLSACAAVDADVLRLQRITLTVSDLARSEAFYHEGLGFTTVSRDTIEDEAYAHLVGVEHARILSLVMRLGGDDIELQQYATPGQPYPAGSRSPDLWFQHFAVIVSDMPRAYEQLRSRVQPEAISEGGPQVLPARNNHVQAFKFRDPDGHPLELLYFPPGSGRPQWHPAGAAALFMGIDHSAIAVSNTPRSAAFYRSLGLKRAYEVINRGPTQEHLDGTFNAVVQITGFLPPPGSGPGVEFLDYRSPSTGRRPPPETASNDIAHVHLTFAVKGLEQMAAALFRRRVPLISPGVLELDRVRFGYGKALMLRDPDGHALMLTE